MHKLINDNPDSGCLSLPEKVPRNILNNAAYLLIALSIFFA